MATTIHVLDNIWARDSDKGITISISAAITDSRTVDPSESEAFLQVNIDSPHISYVRAGYRTIRYKLSKDGFSALFFNSVAAVNNRPIHLRSYATASLSDFTI